MSSVLQDLRYAVRSLGRAPGFAAVVVLTLALGIGANTAIFSLLDQVVLRALAVRAPGRARAARRSRHLPRPHHARPRLLAPDVPRPAAGHHRLQRADRAGRRPACRSASAIPSERVVAEMVSGNTFEVLGATPAIGRFFTAAEDVVKGGHPVIVLSDAFWQRRFNRAPVVVGQSRGGQRHADDHHRRRPARFLRRARQRAPGVLRADGDEAAD